MEREYHLPIQFHQSHTPIADKPDFGTPANDASDRFLALINTHSADWPAGKILTFEGDEASPTYVLVGGWLAVLKSLDNGQRQIIDILLPGDFLDPNSGEADASALQIEPLTDAKVAVIPRGKWLHLLDEDPKITALTIGENRAASLRLGERMLRLGKGSAQSIIAYAFCELYQRQRALGQVDTGKFHSPMTQQQLGEFTGMSAVHVCRTLRRLRLTGILDVTDHMEVEILDFDGLADIAGIDPDMLGDLGAPGI